MTAPAAADDREDGALRAEFFEAVRQIIRASGAPIDEPAIGGAVAARDEPVRFTAMQGSRHPDAEIAAVAREAESGPVTMAVAFMGLTGPSGVMPDHYTELVVARDRARDAALGDLLDLFNHRALSLFYRAWGKYRLPVRFAEAGGTLTDPFSRALAALAGLSTPGGDPRMLGAVGLLARRVRSPDALRRVLAVLMGLPVDIVELQPRRIRIEPDAQTRLGTSLAPRGRYAQLGQDAVAGDTAIDVSGKFRVRVGPLDAHAFAAFFEAGGVRARMTETIRQVAGATVDFDIQLVLRGEAVPRTRVGGGHAARLGQNSWLLDGPSERDRADAVLSRRPPDAPIGRDAAASRQLPPRHNV